jgi:hypothetical protein
MRDLYHRKKRLEYWLNRVNNDLQETDRNDVLKLVEHMQDRERSILWIIRCITALLTIRKQLGKSFREVTKDDIRSFLKWMDDKKYKASTNATQMSWTSLVLDLQKKMMLFSCYCNNKALVHLKEEL